jgi:two-component system sensor histidine kinase/response regulator
MERSFSGLRVIAADDDTVGRIVLERQLAALGCTAHMVRDGTSLLKRLDPMLHDLVILDVCMPALSGNEVVRRIRALSTPAALLPILLISAEQANLTTTDPPCPRLLKPLTLSDLRSALSACLRLARTA